MPKKQPALKVKPKKTLQQLLRHAAVTLVTAGLLSLGLTLTHDHDSLPRAVQQSGQSAVQLRSPSGRGSCSGVQVQAPSGDLFVLSAGHCRPLAENGIILVSAQGKKPVPRMVIEESDKYDLMLIEALQNVPGVQVGRDPRSREPLYSVTHARGLKAQEGKGHAIQDIEVELLDHVIDSSNPNDCTAPKYRKKKIDMFFWEIEACMLVVNGTISDVSGIKPGSSGGPIFSRDGRLAGIVSGGGDGYTVSVLPSSVAEFLTGR